SHATVEHIIEKTVSWVVIVVSVAAKSIPIKHYSVDLGHGFHWWLQWAPFLLHGLSYFIEQIQIGIQLQLRIFFVGNHQRGFRKRYCRIGQGYQLLKSLT